MNDAVLILPIHLFADHPCLSPGRLAVLCEEDRYFSDFAFHKKKLVLHRASMRAYMQRLVAAGYRVIYVDHDKGETLRRVRDLCLKKSVTTLHCAEIADHVLGERLQEAFGDTKIRFVESTSPGFLTPPSWAGEVFAGVQHYSMTHFYIEQRKRLAILVDNGRPLGGKWSYDPENRRRLPKGLPVPRIGVPSPSQYVEEAERYVHERFPRNPGDAEGFIYPVTTDDALRWFEDFLVHRLSHFGEYEDAISTTHPFLFHSVMTPALNVGLITPQKMVDMTISYASRHEVPLNSLEGFIRQVIGWREFMKIVYDREGVKQKSMNFWGHHREIPLSFYNGTSGIEPVDTVIKRVLKNAYAHHIERLMVLGNFMLLCGIRPDEVYRWFMELFIDSYDWVMAPNVFGMSQYADGGLITTKPYLSGSNYLKKMSDFRAGPWCEIWDGLYWRFIHAHRDFFARNPRLGVMARQLDRMGQATLNGHIGTAEEFLRRLK